MTSYIADNNNTVEPYKGKLTQGKDILKYRYAKHETKQGI